MPTWIRGTCEVLFVTEQEDLVLDLVVDNADGRLALPPGAPVSVTLVPDVDPVARRTLRQRLAGWCEQGSECDVTIGIDGSLRLTGPDGRRVVTMLSSVDASYPDAHNREHTD